MPSWEATKVRTHTTEAELDFIKKLGTWSNRFDRDLLLEGYRAGLFLRNHWGNLDRVAIFAAVDAAIVA